MIKQQILELTPLEVDALDAWDRQIVLDLETGHLESLIGKALEGYCAVGLPNHNAANRLIDADRLEFRTLTTRGG